MRLIFATLIPLCVLAAACSDPDSGAADRPAEAGAQAADNNGADTMASNDNAPADAVADSEPRPVMQMQVVLERLGFAPGVIDGKEGASLSNALKGFQESRGLPVTGTLDDATRSALGEFGKIPATRIVTIPADWGQIAFAKLPEAAADKAKLESMAYESMAEKLAERFHTTPAVLAQLNPGGMPAGMGSAAPAATPAATPSANQATGEPAVPTFGAGQQIRVPNVGADRIDASLVDNDAWRDTLRSLGVGTEQPKVARILVDESEGWLKAYDEGDKLVAMFTVTTGSKHDPLPIGDWKIKGKAYNPTYAFNPELLRDVDASEGKHQLPAGPNSPVGVVWIDLSKDHYGIHGTPSPETIGRAESNGCVRLTNWDAARLALMVSPSTKVTFQK
ncbi:L,D-transpeptidase family protein [Erythrobacter neustonensis]|nr:L,D-transpeptidase family protein [Erythrobacter neustonensis]